MYKKGKLSLGLSKRIHTLLKKPEQENGDWCAESWADSHQMSWRGPASGTSYPNAEETRAPRCQDISLRISHGRAKTVIRLTLRNGFRWEKLCVHSRQALPAGGLRLQLCSPDSPPVPGKPCSTPGKSLPQSQRECYCSWSSVTHRRRNY